MKIQQTKKDLKTSNTGYKFSKKNFLYSFLEYGESSDTSAVTGKNNFGENGK